MIDRPTRPTLFRSTWLLVALLALAPSAMAQTGAPSKDGSKRKVLVELFTSQGCDMCPEAEVLLGQLAREYPNVVPVAFHVDYFDRPWKDVFSTPLSSQRQMGYQEVYRKPKPAEYGLYYTPMMMVDGEQSVNGRDGKTARMAIEAASRKPAAVRWEDSWKVSADGRSATIEAKITPSRKGPAGRKVLACAVARESGVSTAIGSGENKGKTLLAEAPARQIKFKILTLGSDGPTDVSFDLAADPGWNLDRVRVLFFVQDQKTGEILRTDDRPWRAAPDLAGPGG